MRKVLLILLLSCLYLQTQALAHISGDELSTAANKVLNSLNENQRAKACFDFDNKERTHWIYVPSVRLGLPIKELSDAQQKLVQELLAASLSPVGKNKVLGVMLLEEYLRVKEQGKGQFVRDPGLYYLSFFGTPTANGTWGWRWEGHHCSQNFTIVDGKLIGATPSFIGANPGKINDDKSTDNGFELLAFEDLKGRELAQSMSPEQFKKAQIKGETPKDVVTKNTSKLSPTLPKGISLKDISPAQKKILGQIIVEYVGRGFGNLGAVGGQSACCGVGCAQPAHRRDPPRRPAPVAHHQPHLCSPCAILGRCASDGQGRGPSCDHVRRHA